MLGRNFKTEQELIEELGEREARDVIKERNEQYREFDMVNQKAEKLCTVDWSSRNR